MRGAHTARRLAIAQVQYAAGGNNIVDMYAKLSIQSKQSFGTYEFQNQERIKR